MTNPLQQYFRQFKTYLTLPSGTSYYDPSVVEFTSVGEVGVMAMTGRDELILNNPDALLNGEAVISVIKSCVPSVKEPNKLLANDIDALVTAIRLATYNDSLATSAVCVSCGKIHSFNMDLQYALDNMEYLDSEYVVELSSGLSAYVKPYSFDDTLKSLRTQFEQAKLVKLVANEEISDEEKSKKFGESYAKLTKLSYDMVVNNVVKLVNVEDSIEVIDHNHIKEFMFNIEKADSDKISDLIKKINAIGIKRTFTAKCDACGHQWETEIDFNPVNFS